MLDVLIPHIVHMTYFDYTLSILQNFEKTIWSQKTWMKFIDTFCFLKVLKKRSVVKICGQCEVSKRLAYRHILKSVVKKLEEKNQKFSFSKLDLSSHAICRAAPPKTSKSTSPIVLPNTDRLIFSFVFDGKESLLFRIKILFNLLEITGCQFKEKFSHQTNFW